MKIKIDPVDAVLVALIALFLLLWIASCNPVKQVLRDQNKLDAVARVVVAGGYCANDTTYIVKSDTTVQVDTLIQNDRTIQVETRNDTTYLTRLKYREIVRSITIRDTIKSVVVDNARLKLIEGDLAAQKLETMEWRSKAHNRGFWLIMVAVVIGFLLYLKYKK